MKPQTHGLGVCHDGSHADGVACVGRQCVGSIPSATSTYAHDTNYDLEDIFLPLPLRYHYCDHDGLGWAKPGHAGCQAMPAYDEGRQRLPKRRCCRTTTISVTSSAIIAALTGLFAYYAPLA